MSTKIQKRQTAAVSLADARDQKSGAFGSPPPELDESPLYGVALLKIALEMKKPGAKGLEEILSGVLARMRIPETEFRTFLELNGGMLKTLAESKGL